MNVVVGQKALRCLVSWLVQRYERGAFPDAFNERCRMQKKAIENVLKRHGVNLSGIYIRLDVWDEIDDSNEYEVILCGTAKQNIFDDHTLIGPVYEVIDKLEETLNKCDGIRVVDALLMSEADFSLEDAEETRKWNWEYLSLREEESVDSHS